MRPTSTANLSYQPGDPPANPADLQRFLREELAKLKAAIDTVSDGFLPVVYVLPAKPRTGMLRNFVADVVGVGSAAGMYRFDGTTWVFIG